MQSQGLLFSYNLLHHTLTWGNAPPSGRQMFAHEVVTSLSSPFPVHSFHGHSQTLLRGRLGWICCKAPWMRKGTHFNIYGLHSFLTQRCVSTNTILPVVCATERCTQHGNGWDWLWEDISNTDGCAGAGVHLRGCGQRLLRTLCSLC